MPNINVPAAQRTASEKAHALKHAAHPSNFVPVPGDDLDLLLTSKQVCEWLGRSHASLYRDIAGGQIPPPVKIGHSSRWPASEIRDLIEKAKAARDEAAK